MRKKLGYTLCVFFAILLLSACGKQSSTEGNPMTIKVGFTAMSAITII